MQETSPVSSLTPVPLRRGERIFSPLTQRLAATWVVDAAGPYLLLFCGSLLAIMFALRVVGRADKWLLLWPVSGMALGLALPDWANGWRARLGLLVAGAAGTICGSFLVGAHWWPGLMTAGVMSVDMLIAGAFLSPRVKRFDDLKTWSNMLRFLATAVVSPAITGLLSALTVSGHIHAPFWKTAAMSILANSLGIAVMLPAVLFLTGGEYRSLTRLRPHWRGALGSTCLFLAVAGWVFWQNIGPFLFFVFPPMIVLLLALGLEGAVFTSVTLSVVGWIATSHHHGPIMLIAGGSPWFQLLVLQVFVWVSLATALPVGALIDDRRRAERSAHEAQCIYQLLLLHTQDTIVLSSLDGAQRYASPAIEKLTGWTPEQYLGLSRKDTVHEEDQDVIPMLQQSLRDGKREHTIRYRLMRKDGSCLWAEATIRAYGEQEVAGYVGTIRDISAQKQSEETWQHELHVLTEEKQRMADLARTDPLTGLMNRRGLEESLCRQGGIGPGRMAVLMIDVDFFKLYNDTYGHPAGDRCLEQLAEVLRAHAARNGDLVARLGGEEFAVLLPGADLVGGMKVAGEICEALAAQAIPHTASPLGKVSISMGVAAKTAGLEMDVNLLLAQADRALYASKRSGKNRATVYEARLELARA